MRQVRFLAVASFLVGVSILGQAAADEPDTAEQLFREGHALLKEQRYSEACGKFAESQRHDPASGTLLALAYCQELAGLLASAQTSYIAASELARTEKQDERQHAASERAEALTARLSTLTVRIPEPLWSVVGLHVTSNGADVAPASWGRPVPSDGGTFDIRVSAPGRSPWSTRVMLAPERDQRVVDVPLLTTVGSGEATPGPRSAVLTQSTPPTLGAHYWTTPRAVGWTVIGAGAVSGIAAVYFAVSAKSAQSDVENMLRAEESAPLSERTPWDASGQAREADGRQASALAQGFGVASGALLLGGAALVIFGGDKEDHETPSVSLGITPGAARVGYAGAF